MTAEQKAKAYDEAIERANDILKGYDPKEDSKATINYIFPQLKEKESEDEKIRKELIDFFWKEKIFLQEAHSSVENNPKYHFVMDAIAWLEKQGEKESDIRYKYLNELLTADDIYQMSMNEAMTNEAKIKAVNALSNLCISKLLGLEKQGSNLVENGYTNNKDIVKYADNYSRAIWHKLMDNFKNIKDYHIGCNDVSDIVLNAIIDAYNWLEKQSNEPNWCHHKVDLSDCSEEYRKAYYDGWNNCNQQHSQCKSEGNDVVKCLINGMKFYYEDNEEATWGTEKFSMKVKDILDWLEKQGKETSEKEFTFKALPRLLEMIEVSDRAKAYTEKLAVALDNEGYHTDAKIVRESIKIMNGEEVPMATMDEDERIKKELIFYLGDIPEDTELRNGVTNRDVLVWLEKQGEQKTVDDIQKPTDIRIHEGDKNNPYDMSFEEAQYYISERGFDICCVDYPVFVDDKYILQTIGNILKWADDNPKRELFDNIEQKFKVGDWIVRNYKDSGTFIYKVVDVKKINDESYGYKLDDGTYFSGSWEDVYHLWSIADAKAGDILYFNDDTIVIFKDLYNNSTFHSYCHIEDGVFGINSDILPDWWEAKKFKPATKEQRDILFQKMKEAGYEWDAEKKELKEIKKNTDIGHEYFSDLLEKDDCDNIDDYASQCAYCLSHDWIRDTATWDDVERACKLGAQWNERHHNSSWSEEDEHRIKDIIYFLDTAKKHYASTVELDACIDWLKSFKQRHTWKPSIEQMEALWCATEKYLESDNTNVVELRGKVLESLYNELKKIKGE